MEKDLTKEATKIQSSGASTNLPNLISTNKSADQFSIEQLGAKLVQNLTDNRQFIQKLKQEIDHLKALFEPDSETNDPIPASLSSHFIPPDELEISGSRNGLSSLRNDLKASLDLNGKYQDRIDDLQAQVTEQEDLIQEHEESIQTLMASFRARAFTLQHDAQNIRKTYERNLSEEKRTNHQLVQDNYKLRQLLLGLSDFVQEGMLNQLEEDELLMNEELTKLEQENQALRGLLKISDISLND